MKIRDIIFLILIIYIITLISWDKEAVKAIVTGIVATYYVMRRFR